MSKQKTILVLDDEKDIHYVFDRIFQKRFKILHAFSVKEAIEKSFHEKHVDLVITDVFLGGETGFELVSKVREISSKIPVIIISAYAENFTEDLLSGIKNTFSCHFLKKPFNNEEIEALVAKLLGE